MQLLSLVAAVLFSSWAPVVALAQDTIRISGDRLSGIVLPIEPITADIRLSALKAFAWEVDDTKRLFLQGDVHIRVGAFNFDSDTAVVWLNRIPSSDGVINQIALYFDDVSDPGGEAGLGAAGQRLLVTGSSRGAVKLNVVALRPEKASENSTIQRGEQRLAEYLKRLVAGQPTLERYPQVDRLPKPAMPELVPGGTPPASIPDPDLPTQLELPPTVGSYPLFDPTGSISMSAGSVEVMPGTEENVILASDSLVVEYVDKRGDRFNHLTISAERGVVFTKPGPIGEVPTLSMDADFVRGIYLEGNVVATDGDYTLHGSRVYYDVQNNRAIILDGVLRTYSREVGRPVYARAQEFRQVARDSFTMDRASVSTSEFFTPHLSIGARQVEIERRPGEGVRGATETYLVSKDNTVRLGNVPVLYWPHLSGTVNNVPLKDVELGYEDNQGAKVLTTWDIHALMGQPSPESLDALLKVGGYSQRGPALGLELDYAAGEHAGVVDLFGLFDAGGVDKASTGVEVDVDYETRGFALLEHQWRLNTNLTFQGQISYISDPTFITSFFEDEFTERREYETSAYLRNIDDNTAWTALAKVDINNFVSNSYLLASRALTVEKLPEFTYRRYGDSLFGDEVTWSSEYRYSRMAYSFIEQSPDEIGVRGRAFGIADSDRLDELMESRGLTQDFVNRLDMRQEFAVPSQWGIVDIYPFIVGRATWYDTQFDSFSSDEDDLRLFGAAGLRLSTVFQHVDDSVESRLFDLHRIRHLIEPSILLWYGWSDLDQADLPIYDESVESLATGGMTRFGLRNTWQTQRGGPGYWHSVDVFTLDTALVLTTRDTDLEHPVPQIFEYRPEYSNMGDHVEVSFAWLVSDSLSLIGESTYDLDDSRVARGSIGALLQHNPDFSTYAEFRYIDASDSELLSLGWVYQITPKYRLGLSPQWDFRADDFRSLRVDFTRSFPDFDFTISVKRDEIKNDTALGASMRVTSF